MKNFQTCAETERIKCIISLIMGEEPSFTNRLSGFKREADMYGYKYFLRKQLYARSWALVAYPIFIVCFIFTFQYWELNQELHSLSCIHNPLFTSYFLTVSPINCPNYSGLTLPQVGLELMTLLPQLP